MSEKELVAKVAKALLECDIQNVERYWEEHAEVAIAAAGINELNEKIKKLEKMITYFMYLSAGLEVPPEHPKREQYLQLIRFVSEMDRENERRS